MGRGLSPGVIAGVVLGWREWGVRLTGVARGVRDFRIAAKR